jgi:hypothetical protein
VNRPTICQSGRMGRLYSQDSKPKVSKEANAILIFIENNFYKGVPWETCYSIDSSQSLNARFFSSSGYPNGGCEENEVLNS